MRLLNIYEISREVLPGPGGLDPIAHPFRTTWLP